MGRLRCSWVTSIYCKYADNDDHADHDDENQKKSQAMSSLNFDIVSSRHHERGLCGGGRGWTLVSLHHPWQVAVPLSTSMVNMMHMWVMMMTKRVNADDDDNDDDDIADGKEDIADGKEDIADDDDYDCVLSDTTTPP